MTKNSVTKKLKRWIAGENYTEVERLLWSVCWKMQRQTKMPFDELLSIAHQRFLESIAKHDATQCAFSTFLSNAIMWAILDEQRKRSVRSSRESLVSELMPIIDARRPTMCSDSITVWEIVSRNELRWKRRVKIFTPIQLQRLLRRDVHRKTNWPWWRVDNAIDLLEDAIE